MSIVVLVSFKLIFMSKIFFYQTNFNFSERFLCWLYHQIYIHILWNIKCVCVSRIFANSQVVVFLCMKFSKIRPKVRYTYRKRIHDFGCARFLYIVFLLLLLYCACWYYPGRIWRKREIEYDEPGLTGGPSFGVMRRSSRSALTKLWLFSIYLCLYILYITVSCGYYYCSAKMKIEIHRIDLLLLLYIFWNFLFCLCCAWENSAPPLCHSLETP